MSAAFRASEAWWKLVRRTEGRPNPIGVGGIGGSGTRVVSDLLEKIGLDAGPVRSGTRDALAWPKFRPALTTTATEHEMVEWSFKSLDRFAKLRERHLAARADGAWHWFWKVPTTFMWLDYLSEYFPGLRYVHVVRHGLDMAFSGNDNQVRNWAAAFGLNVGESPSPVDMLDYWIVANRYTAAKAAELLGERVLWLSYDELCLEPERTIGQLLRFLEPSPERIEMSSVLPLIRPSPGIGRYRAKDCVNLFGRERLDAVEAFGFSID